MKALDTILWAYIPSGIGDYVIEADEQIKEDKAKIIEMMREAFEAGRKTHPDAMFTNLEGTEEGMLYSSFADYLKTQWNYEYNESTDRDSTGT